MTIKMSVTKKQAAEKIVDLLERKFENKNQSAIGISVDEEGGGKIDYGFSCHNDEPTFTLFDGNNGVEALGDCPDIEDWNNEIRAGLIEWICDSWFSEITDENGEPISIEFAQ